MKRAKGFKSTKKEMIEAISELFNLFYILTRQLFLDDLMLSYFFVFLGFLRLT